MAGECLSYQFIVFILAYIYPRYAFNPFSDPVFKLHFAFADIKIKIPVHSGYAVFHDSGMCAVNFFCESMVL